MTLRIHIPAVAAALAVAVLPAAAAAQTKADAFAGRIPPVSGQLFEKAGRLEVTASGNLSLNDAFFTKYFGGLDLRYHLSDAWSFGAGARGFFAGKVTPSGSAVVCSANTGCSGATDAQLRQVPGRIQGILAGELAWAPVYGKLNILAEKVAHFDLAILAGVDLISHDDVLSRADALGGRTPDTIRAIGYHAGLGAHLFFTEAMSLRLAVKDVVYPVKVPNNGVGTDWQNQLFTEIGFSVFFPTHNRPQR